MTTEEMEHEIGSTQIRAKGSEFSEEHKTEALKELGLIQDDRPNTRTRADS